MVTPGSRSSASPRPTSSTPSATRVCSCNSFGRLSTSSWNTSGLTHSHRRTSTPTAPRCCGTSPGKPGRTARMENSSRSSSCHARPQRLSQAAWLASPYLRRPRPRRWPKRPRTLTGSPSPRNADGSASTKDAAMRRNDLEREQGPPLRPPLWQHIRGPPIRRYSALPKSSATQTHQTVVRSFSTLAKSLPTPGHQAVEGVGGGIRPLAGGLAAVRLLAVGPLAQWLELRTFNP